MLHTIIKRLEICIDINIGLSLADHYTWIFTSGIFRLVLDITFFFSKYFFLQVAYQLLSQSKKLNKQGNPNKNRGGRGDWKIFWKKNKQGGTLIRDPRVISISSMTLLLTILVNDQNPCQQQKSSSNTMFITNLWLIGKIRQIFSMISSGSMSSYNQTVASSHQFRILKILIDEALLKLFI